MEEKEENRGKKNQNRLICQIYKNRNSNKKIIALWGPIVPCIQTALEEATSNI